MNLMNKKAKVQHLQQKNPISKFSSSYARRALLAKTTFAAACVATVDYWWVYHGLSFLSKFYQKFGVDWS